MPECEILLLHLTLRCYQAYKNNKIIKHGKVHLYYMEIIANSNRY